MVRFWLVRARPELARVRDAGPERNHEKGRGGRGGYAGPGWVEIAQTVLAGAHFAILRLAPYLDRLRWVFFAVMLDGIAVTNYARWDGWQRGRR